MMLHWIRSVALVAAGCLLAGLAGAQTAATPIASVETRWDDVYCDLTAVTLPAPNELQVRFRYRNTGEKPLRFPTLNDYVAQTLLIDTENRVVYEPLKDPAGKIAGSATVTGTGAGRTLDPGASQAHWVKLPAPETTSDLAVVVQGCVPFENVTPGGEPARVDPMTKPRAALAVEEMQTEGMMVEVLDLRHTPGGTLTLIFRYRNSGGQEYRFPTLQNQVPEVYLLDSENRTKYEVLRDKARRWLASSTTELGGSGTLLEPGETLTMWAKFEAPPASVRTVSLIVPEAPPFDGLEIAGSGTEDGAEGAAMSGRATGLEAALRDLGAEVAEMEIRIAMAADVLFDFDQAQLKPEAEPSLGQVAEVIQAHPDATVVIEGHTDARGADDYNQRLSEQRAAAVAGWLTQHAAVSPGRIETKGWGSGKPVAHNTQPDGSDNPEGRAKNRRVEILVRK